jgi:hypothetical protein
MVGFASKTRSPVRATALTQTHRKPPCLSQKTCWFEIHQRNTRAPVAPFLQVRGGDPGNRKLDCAHHLFSSCPTILTRRKPSPAAQPGEILSLAPEMSSLRPKSSPACTPAPDQRAAYPSHARSPSSTTEVPRRRARRVLKTRPRQLALLTSRRARTSYNRPEEYPNPIPLFDPIPAQRQPRCLQRAVRLSFALSVRIPSPQPRRKSGFRLSIFDFRLSDVSPRSVPRTRGSALCRVGVLLAASRSQAAMPLLSLRPPQRACGVDK